MKFSTKVRYGLRAMVELARRHDGEPVQLNTVADQHEISPKYLHAVMQQLRVAGLVRTVRGAHGGFVLSRPPETITLANVVEAIDGALVVVDCARETCDCPRAPECVVRSVWCEVSAAMRDVLEAQTLASLAARAAPVEASRSAT